MNDRINRFLERVADGLAKRPGIPILVAVCLVVINFILRLFPGSGYWFVDLDVLLHAGVIIGLVGVLLIRPLG